MINLFYTGASSYLGDQAIPLLSLGGYVSKTPVMNGVINNIFPDLNIKDFFKNKADRNCIGIAAIDMNSNLPNYKNYTFKIIPSMEDTSAFQYFKFSMCIGPMGGNVNDSLYLEQLQNSKSIPFYYLNDIGFKELPLNVEVLFNKISPSGFGIWIKRELLINSFETNFGENSEYWVANSKFPNLEIDFNLQIVESEYVD